MTDYRERRGAHRPQGMGLGAAIPWVLAAIAVVAVIVVATRLFGGDEPATPTAKPPAKSIPAASGAATNKPTASTTPKPTGVDKTKPAQVLNNTGKAGLAKKVAVELRAAGWTIPSTDNYTKGKIVTTVFYGNAGLAETAQALAKDLGGPAEVKESADLGPENLTVVLGSDFQG